MALRHWVSAGSIAGLPRRAERINEPHYSLIKTHPLEQPQAIFVRREQFQRAPRTA